MPRTPDDLEDWRNLAGGKFALKEKLEHAWERTIDHFGRVFKPKRKYYTLALIRQSLPIPDLLANDHLQKEYQKHLAHYGATGPYKEYFGLQNNGLDEHPTYPPRVLLQEFSDQIFTGFQTRAPGNLYPESATPEQRQNFMRETIFNGIRFGGRFIEIYESDIKKGDLRNLIMAAAAILGGAKPECQCQ